MRCVVNHTSDSGVSDNSCILKTSVEVDLTGFLNSLALIETVIHKHKARVYNATRGADALSHRMGAAPGAVSEQHRFLFIFLKFYCKTRVCVPVYSLQTVGYVLRLVHFPKVRLQIRIMVITDFETL